MNKKITAVTLTALMVLTMFTAMVPTASAAVITDEVSAPYEFLGAVQAFQANGDANFSLTSASQPSLLYYDFEEGEGKETLKFNVTDNKTLVASTLLYETGQYEAGTDSAWSYKIAWLGKPYAVIDNTSDMVLGKILFDEDTDDCHLLRVGESLALPDGFAVTAQEIDVDGEEAWFFVTKDGEELYSTVTSEGWYFEYKEDLNNSNKKDNIILSFGVEVVFAGMNTNMVKICNVQLISDDIVTVENGDTDTITDYKIYLVDTNNKIQVKLKDTTTSGDISLSKGGTTAILDRFNVKINKDGEYIGLTKTITESGVFELFAEVQDFQANGDANFSLSSLNHPSVLYFDFDEGLGAETLKFNVTDNKTLVASTLLYETGQYEAGTDSAWSYKIAWLGKPYAVIDNTSDMVLGKILFDEDTDDCHLLRVGESLALPDGFAVTAQEIDVDGEEAWFFVTKDGEELYSTVTSEGWYFEYKEDLNNSNKKDNIILSFGVEVVFAGMNTNMVKICNVQLISDDIVTVENGDTDTITDYKIYLVDTNNKIQVKLKDTTTSGDISLSKGGTTAILDRFNVKINKDGDIIAVVKVVEVGGGAVATATATTVGTEEPTDEPTNVTGDVTVDGTAVVTAVETEEVTEPEPTDVPGFEAVFAVAGLLAVAYLVLRQRE